MVVELIYQHLYALCVKLQHISESQDKPSHCPDCAQGGNLPMYLFCSAIDTVDILYKMDILLLEGANIFVKHVLQGEHI